MSAPRATCRFYGAKAGENQRIRRGVRVVEGARLESVYTATYRGFESLSLRQTKP